MRWKKLGLIFDPTKFNLPNNCVDFAQSPQALVFDEFVRVYFSTRELEADGKNYLSHIAYVDLSKNFRDILRVSTHQVFPLGKPGCFDEHGVFPLNVLRHNELIYGFSSGVSRRVSVAVDTAIGFAVSKDQGHTFERIGDGPVLAASLHEPCLVADPFVIHESGTFHMWYIFGAAWKSFSGAEVPDRIYKIGHATSPDGITWAGGQGRRIVSDVLGPDECQALPTVMRINDEFHMFFCFRQPNDFRNNPARSYRIGHATSDDLVEWKRTDSTLRLDCSASGWDSEMLCYPHVFGMDGEIYMLYNGNNFGRRGFGVAQLIR
jgi:hypothetical protein